MFWLAMGALAAATALGFAVARADREHLPAAATLAAWLGSNLARHYLGILVLRPARVAAGVDPFIGGARAAFHLEQALFLASVFSVPALAWWTFRRYPWPPVASYGVALTACVLGYPTLRGDVLGRAYGALTGVAVALSFAAVGLSSRAPMSARGQNPSGISRLVSLLFTAGLAATLLGPFLGEPFKSWSLAQATWSITFAAIAVVQGRSLWRIRRLSVG